MKTVKQVLNQYTDKEILTRYMEKYPNQNKSRKGYADALTELRTLFIGESDMVLSCSLYGCTGKMPNDDTNWGVAIPWSDFLACKLRRATLDSLCNALYEITYHGYSSKEVSEFWTDMFEHVEKIKKYLDKKENENLPSNKKL